MRYSLLLLLLAGQLAAQAPARTANADPDSARIITSDIALFWDVMDRAPADSLEAWLQREYLDKATVGVRDFIPGRIQSARALADMITRRRGRYDSARTANFQIDSAVPAIRAAFHRLRAIYPEAVFPDVYFVIGRLNSGGTASRNGLLIGAEMYRSTQGLPAIVSHELIHFQQNYTTLALLWQSFKEGSADFVGEMISGAQINNEAHRYGLAHEHELWREFLLKADSLGAHGWMYSDPPGERPPDLGYFIGYRIAQAYYNQAADKAQAIRDIISPPGGNVRRLLEQSGYTP